MDADGAGPALALIGMALCWICTKMPRATVKKRECPECYKDWDSLQKDAKRKGQLDFFKNFKATASDEQLRRLLFTWKAARKENPSTGQKKHLFPWSAVSRRWAIRRELTEGKGGSLKCYTAFCKYYIDQKGFTPEKAHKHWEFRKVEKGWRRGVDNEDYIMLCVLEITF